jgi:hypothetical protein
VGQAPVSWVGPPECAAPHLDGGSRSGLGRAPTQCAPSPPPWAAPHACCPSGAWCQPLPGSPAGGGCSPRRHKRSESQTRRKRRSLDDTQQVPLLRSGGVLRLERPAPGLCVWLIKGWDSEACETRREGEEGGEESPHKLPARVADPKCHSPPHLALKSAFLAHCQV